MARQITKKRGKSPIKTRLEQERKAGRRDPEGKKSVVSKAAIASLAIPGSAAVKAGAKAAKAGKTVTRPSVLPKGKANISTTTDKKIVDTKKLKRLMKKKIVLRRMARQKAELKRDNLEKVFTKKSRKNMKPSGSTRKRRMEEGGLVKKHRGDGIAKRGRTKGRII